MNRSVKLQIWVTFLAARLQFGIEPLDRETIICRR